MKFTLKKIFLVAFTLCLVGILLWMFFSKIKEGNENKNYDCGDLNNDECNTKNGCKWNNNKCSLNKDYDCYSNKNSESCGNHPYACKWKKKSGHRTSACYLKGTV